MSDSIVDILRNVNSQRLFELGLMDPVNESVKIQTAEERAIGNIERLGKIMLGSDTGTIYFDLNTDCHIEQHSHFCSHLNIPDVIESGEELRDRDFSAVLNETLAIVFLEVQSNEDGPYAITYGAEPFNKPPKR